MSGDPGAAMHLRAWDLLRQMRFHLQEAELISLAEFAWLAAYSPAADPRPGMGSTAPRRLETYDGMKARVDELEAGILQAVDVLKTAGGDDDELAAVRRLAALLRR